MDLPAPVAVQIDASSHCQLACPVCPTANGLTRPTLGAGHLKLADFERLLDRNPQIRTVELSNYGEMFLNPQLPELLACAFERQVVVSGSNGVNLNFASDAALEAVVKYWVRALTCSMTALPRKPTRATGVNGNLARVLAHVDRIRDLRRTSGAAFPLLDWQFVVMGHNEHEIELARSMARARGMEFDPAPHLERRLFARGGPRSGANPTGLGAAGREEFAKRRAWNIPAIFAHQLWHAPVINWDGRMLGCCVNYWGDFGVNVFVEGLDAAMRNSKLEYARRMLLGGAEPQTGIPCTTCDQYQAMARTRNWLCEEELQNSAYGKLLVGLAPDTARIADSREFDRTRPSIHASIRRFGPFIPLWCRFRDLFPCAGPRTIYRFRAVSGSGRLGKIVEACLRGRVDSACRKSSSMPAPALTGMGATSIVRRPRNPCPTGSADARHACEGRQLDRAVLDS